MDIFTDADGNEVFRIDDSGKLIRKEELKIEDNKKKCEHVYPRGPIDRVGPRVCQKCGEIEE